jgi:hypothetical protein
MIVCVLFVHKKSVSKRKVCIIFIKNKKNLFLVGFLGVFFGVFLGGFFIANPVPRSIPPAPSSRRSSRPTSSTRRSCTQRVSTCVTSRPLIQCGWRCSRRISMRKRAWRAQCFKMTRRFLGLKDARRAPYLKWPRNARRCFSEKRRVARLKMPHLRVQQNIFCAR